MSAQTKTIGLLQNLVGLADNACGDGQAKPLGFTVVDLKDAIAGYHRDRTGRSTLEHLVGQRRSIVADIFRVSFLADFNVGGPSRLSLR